VKKFDRKRRNFVYLLLAILFAIAVVYIFLNFPPDYKFKIGIFGIPILPFFFISLAIFIFSTITFLLIKKAQGILLVFFFLSYILMRLAGLTHWIFGLLFLALFITIELFILKKK